MTKAMEELFKYVQSKTFSIFLGNFFIIEHEQTSIEDKELQKIITEGIKSARKSILNQELRQIVFNSYKDVGSNSFNDIHNDLNSYDWLDRMPFKAVLFIPKEPVLIESSMRKYDYCTAVASGLFTYRLTPELYYALTINYDFSAKDFYLEGNIMDLKNIKKCWQEIRFSNDKLLDPISTLFVSAQIALQKSTRDKRFYLADDKKAKIVTRDYRGRRIGKTIYSEEVLYLGTSKSLEKSTFACHKRLSKADHAYEVMGHWRELHNPEWTGHDREGNELKGFTWVSEHIRGEGDLLVKTRIVEESENE